MAEGEYFHGANVQFRLAIVHCCSLLTNIQTIREKSPLVQVLPKRLFINISDGNAYIHDAFDFLGNLYTLQSGLQNSLTHLQVQDLQAVSIPSNHFEEITSEAINDHSSQIRPITVTVIPQNNESDDVDGTHHHPDLDDSDYTMDMMAAASDNT